MKDWRSEYRPVEHSPVESRALGKFNPHFKQLRAVAQRAGTDLGEALHERQITAAEYSEMITRCRAASCLQACADWLGETTADHREIPTFCANRAIFEHLRKSR